MVFELHERYLNFLCSSDILEKQCLKLNIFDFFLKFSVPKKKLFIFFHCTPWSFHSLVLYKEYGIILYLVA